MTQKVNPELFRLKDYNLFTTPNIDIFDSLNQFYLFRRNIYFFIKVYSKFNFFFLSFIIHRFYFYKFKLLFIGYSIKKYKFYKRTYILKKIYKKFNYFFLISSKIFPSSIKFSFIWNLSKYFLFKYFLFKYFNYFKISKTLFFKFFHTTVRKSIFSKRRVYRFFKKQRYKFKKKKKFFKFLNRRNKIKSRFYLKKINHSNKYSFYYLNFSFLKNFLKKFISISFFNLILVFFIKYRLLKKTFQFHQSLYFSQYCNLLFSLKIRNNVYLKKSNFFFFKFLFFFLLTNRVLNNFLFLFKFSCSLIFNLKNYFKLFFQTKVFVVNYTPVFSFFLCLKILNSILFSFIIYYYYLFFRYFFLFKIKEFIYLIFKFFFKNFSKKKINFFLFFFFKKVFKLKKKLKKNLIKKNLIKKKFSWFKHFFFNTSKKKTPPKVRLKMFLFRNKFFKIIKRFKSLFKKKYPFIKNKTWNFFLSLLKKKIKPKKAKKRIQKYFNSFFSYYKLSFPENKYKYFLYRNIINLYFYYFKVTQQYIIKNGKFHFLKKNKHRYEYVYEYPSMTYYKVLFPFNLTLKKLSFYFFTKLLYVCYFLFSHLRIFFSPFINYFIFLVLYRFNKESLFYSFYFFNMFFSFNFYISSYNVFYSFLFKYKKKKKKKLNKFSLKLTHVIKWYRFFSYKSRVFFFRKSKSVLRSLFLWFVFNINFFIYRFWKTWFRNNAWKINPKLRMWPLKKRSFTWKLIIKKKKLTNILVLKYFPLKNFFKKINVFKLYHKTFLLLPKFFLLNLIHFLFRNKMFIKKKLKFFLKYFIFNFFFLQSFLNIYFFNFLKFSLNFKKLIFLKSVYGKVFLNFRFKKWKYISKKYFLSFVLLLWFKSIYYLTFFIWNGFLKKLNSEKYLLKTCLKYLRIFPLKKFGIFGFKVLIKGKLFKSRRKKIYSIKKGKLPLLNPLCNIKFSNYVVRTRMGIFKFYFWLNFQK